MLHGMNVYPWLVVLHVIGVLFFFIAHGVSISVAFALKRESDPDRIRALLDLSRASLGAPVGVAVAVGFVAGVAAGFVGGWWGQLWIWISLALFVGVTIVMTPMAASRLNAIRIAAGAQPPAAPFARRPADPPTMDPVELRRQLDAWNPAPIAALGLISFVAIVSLMLLKPF